ncbi:sulfotransferase family 2 domain-containing protein [Thermodesulfobacteriota bacterium]
MPKVFLFDYLLTFLPYDTRRLLFKSLKSDEYNALQDRRTVDTDNGYSLKPFDQHKCIFIHIPKCAGVSISKSLFGNLAGGHMKMFKYKIVFSRHEFNSYFKFTFVRNPWDRLVSSYFFLKEGGYGENDRMWAEANLNIYKDFTEFVKKGVYRKKILRKQHFVPQYKFICMPGQFATDLDFIGYFENLEKDFQYVSDKLGIKCALRFENVGKKRKRDYRQYYNSDTKRIVSDIYHKDIEMFGYSFD